jgi:hypothetical protein
VFEARHLGDAMEVVHGSVLTVVLCESAQRWWAHDNHEPGSIDGGQVVSCEPGQLATLFG